MDNVVGYIYPWLVFVLQGHMLKSKTWLTASWVKHSLNGCNAAGPWTVLFYTSSYNDHNLYGKQRSPNISKP